MLAAGQRWDWSGGRLLRTINGGETWVDVTPPGFVQVTLGNAGSSHEGEYFSGSRFALFSTFSYDDQPFGLWRTSDGGKSWAFFKRDDILQDFHFTDANHGWARTEDMGAGSAYVRFFQTTDGGITWTPILFIPPDGVDDSDEPPGTIHLSNIAGDQIAYFPPAKAIITTDNNLDYERPKGSVHLQLTTDLGKTWRELILPLPAGKYHDDFFHTQLPVFFDAHHGLLPVTVFEYSNDNDGSYHQNKVLLIFYRTNDGGETWSIGPQLNHDDLESQGQGPSLFDEICLISSLNIVVRNGANLCVTHDGGKSWRTITPVFMGGSAVSDPDHWHLEFLDDTHATNTIYDDLGNHTLYLTSDGGATWTEFPLKTAFN